MKYSEFVPHPALRDLVDTYWSMEGHSSGVAEPIIPDGRGELVLNLADPFMHAVDGNMVAQPSCLMAGQISRPLWLVPGARVRLIGVRFAPAAQSTLLRESASGMRDSWFDATDAMVGLDELSARLALCSSPGPALDRYLIHRVGERRPDAVAATACDLFDRDLHRSVSGVADAIGVSTRTIERRFTEHVGLAPKEYQRIRRVARASGFVLHADMTWSGAAHAAGYTDQSHLNHDFLALTGMSPREAFRRGGRLTLELVSPAV